MAKVLPPPTTLLECIDHLAEEVYRHKHNATLDVLRQPLTRDYDSQFERMGAHHNYTELMAPISSVIRGHGMSKFISLVQTEGQAAIAIALNAGDGMVVKITDKSYLPATGTIVPLQLPPIYRQDINGFAIEIFPWVDRKNIKEDDVPTIKEELKFHGLRFKEGDDRVDNIGRMPNGTLTVLDGDALEPLPGNTLTTIQSQEHALEWLRHVETACFPLYSDPAYAAGEISLITSTPDFTEHFSPLIRGKFAPTPPPRSAGFLNRIFGNGLIENEKLR